LTIAFAANVKEYVTIFHLQEIVLSINDINRDIENLVKPVCISAAAPVRHI
jgi:hypothetical protein